MLQTLLNFYEDILVYIGTLQDHFERFLEPLDAYQRQFVEGSFAVGSAFGYILIGLMLGYLAKWATLWIFEKFGLIELLKSFFGKDLNIGKEPIDHLVAVSIGWFVFIIFLRIAVSTLGFTEVEKFLGDLIAYLPNVFLAILIGFFGIRLSKTLGNIIKSAFSMYDKSVGEALSYLAQGIVIFFSFLIMLDYIQIVDEFIIHSFVAGTIGATALATGLAFGLGGKDLAKDLLDKIHAKPKKKKTTKTTKKK